MDKPEIVKVQLVAEFVVQDGDYKEPGTFGPVEMTARQWAEFNLQAAIEAGVNAAREPEPKPERTARHTKRSKS
jgi:hypothetical protein